jgi:hypothetical protein
VPHRRRKVAVSQDRQQTFADVGGALRIYQEAGLPIHYRLGDAARTPANDRLAAGIRFEEDQTEALDIAVDGPDAAGHHEDLA